MEAFEHIVKVFLETQGFVVTTNLKFPVRRKTRKRERDEYQEHGYEIDIVAARRDSLRLGFVKSYFGSRGVERQSFRGIADETKTSHLGQNRLINDRRLLSQVVAKAAAKFGYATKQVQVCYFVGHFNASDEQVVRDHLARIRIGAGGIKVYGLADITAPLIEAAKSKTYHNDPVLVTIKCLQSLGVLDQTVLKSSKC